MVARTPRSGFSLIEALVVLAIGGMALAIIFSIGVKAGDTGFSLGRRAMSAADADIAASDLRTIIRSLGLRPAAAFSVDTDRPTTGEALRLESDVVMERATQCAPQGWAGRMILIVEPSGPELVLFCVVAGRKTPLITMRGGDPAFTYSTDGVTWSSAFSNAPPARRSFQTVQAVRLYVRFAGAPAIDVIEMATSGRPDVWLRRDDGF